MPSGPLHRPPSPRRHFLRTSAVLGSGWGFLGGLPRVGADELDLPAGGVRFEPEIEPLVRFLEETPRECIVEEAVGRIRSGRSYRDLLAALILAGVRNVQPRPSVGFKFHAVLVVNSVHLTSISSPSSDRWLPILWAVDNFKRSQQRDVWQGDWTMGPVREDQVPPAHRARQAFAHAMETWDVEAADAAVAGLARTAGAHEVFELFARYAARDWRSVGHKAIFLANGWRTLQAIGWHHAEPVLRSLAYALLNHHGEPNPAENDLEADRPWRQNRERAYELRSDWMTGTTNGEATAELLETFRTGSPEEASRHVVELVNGGIGPQSVWDAIFAGSAELMFRQAGIPSVHAVTTSNAIHFLFDTAADDALRRRLMLQAASFLPLFRRFMFDRGQVEEVPIDELEAVPAGDSAAEIVSGKDRTAAARKVLGFATDAARAKALIAEVRRQTFLKGRDAHHYKFSAAILEDYAHVSPGWRERLLAASLFYVPSGGENRLVDQVRAALG